MQVIGGLQGINSIKMDSNIFTQAIKNPEVNKNQELDNKKNNLGFIDIMDTAISKVNDTQVNANNMIESLIKGEDVTMHDVMLSVQESQMSMQLMLEVRNKLYEAYQEINGVQL